MNYELNTYNYVRAHPGCRIIHIYEYICELHEKEKNKRSPFKKWVWNLPILCLFDEPSLARVFYTVDRLERQGLVRVEISDRKVYVYPTGKNYPDKGVSHLGKLEIRFA